MNTSKSKEILTMEILYLHALTQRLIESEDFWILNLDTLYPKDFNRELS